MARRSRALRAPRPPRRPRPCGRAALGRARAHADRRPRVPARLPRRPDRVGAGRGGGSAGLAWTAAVRPGLPARRHRPEDRGRGSEGSSGTAEATATAGAHDRQRKVDFVATAAAVLSSSLDYRKTLGEVAALAVRELADSCVVDVRQEDGRVVRLVAQRAEPPPSSPEPDPEPEAGVLGVIRDGRPLVSDTRITAPLVTRGARVVGALTLVTGEHGRSYTSDDLSWVRAVAAMAALLIDNARLYAEVEARADATRAHVRRGRRLPRRPGRSRSPVEPERRDDHRPVRRDGRGPTRAGGDPGLGPDLEARPARAHARGGPRRGASARDGAGRAVDLDLGGRVLRRDGLRLPGHHREPPACRAAGRVHRDGLARAPDAACGRLRGRADPAAARLRARRGGPGAVHLAHRRGVGPARPRRQPDPAGQPARRRPRRPRDRAVRRRRAPRAGRGGDAHVRAAEHQGRRRRGRRPARRGRQATEPARSSSTSSKTPSSTRPTAAGSSSASASRTG